MADPLSIIASILAVASAGIKLSTTLYTYAETAFRADKSLKSIAQDVSLTSAVINELANVLKHEDGSSICSENAVRTAQDTINGCRDVFEEINVALKQSLKGDDTSKPKFSRLGRLVWPLKEQRMELIRSNLDKLKSTLTLMLQVLQYARTLLKDKSSAEVVEQRSQIEALAQINKDCTKKYEMLVKALDKVEINASSNAASPAIHLGSRAPVPQASSHFTLFAQQNPQQSTPAEPTHFDKIINHLENAIDAIETAKKELGASSSVHFHGLHRCHDASHQAKRALQDLIAEEGPAKRMKLTPESTVPTASDSTSFVQGHHPAAPTAAFESFVDKSSLDAGVPSVSRSHQPSQDDRSEVFKSLRVDRNARCRSVLRQILDQNRIEGSVFDYSLWIIFGEREHCFGKDERPLVWYDDLLKRGHQPAFMVKKEQTRWRGFTQRRGASTVVQSEARSYSRGITIGSTDAPPASRAELIEWEERRREGLEQRATPVPQHRSRSPDLAWIKRARNTVAARKAQIPETASQEHERDSNLAPRSERSQSRVRQSAPNAVAGVSGSGIDGLYENNKAHKEMRTTGLESLPQGRSRSKSPAVTDPEVTRGDHRAQRRADRTQSFASKDFEKEPTERRQAQVAMEMEQTRLEADQTCTKESSLTATSRFGQIEGCCESVDTNQVFCYDSDGGETYVDKPPRHKDPHGLERILNPVSEKDTDKPELKKQSKWTDEEDDQLITLRGEGMKWEEIAKYVPGQSAIACRLHYQNVLERRAACDKEMHSRIGQTELAQRADRREFLATLDPSGACSVSGIPITTSWGPPGPYQHSPPGVYASSPQSLGPPLPPPRAAYLSSPLPPPPPQYHHSTPQPPHHHIEHTPQDWSSAIRDAEPVGKVVAPQERSSSLPKSIENNNSIVDGSGGELPASDPRRTRRSPQSAPISLHSRNASTAKWDPLFAPQVIDDPADVVDDLLRQWTTVQPVEPDVRVRTTLPGGVL